LGLAGDLMWWLLPSTTRCFLYLPALRGTSVWRYLTDSRLGRDNTQLEAQIAYVKH
jgi:hypothetical protein